VVNEKEDFSLFPEVIEKFTSKPDGHVPETVMSDLTVDSTAAKYWEDCKKIIKDNVQPQVYKTWFEALKAYKCEDKNLIVIAPSQFFAEWIDQQYGSLVRKAIEKVIGNDAKIIYKAVVVSNKDDIESRSISVQSHRFPPTAPQSVALPFDNQEKPDKNEINKFLIPHYTFDNFIQGESNQLASSASIAISKNPGKTSFNPLVIYGDTGLGKTHLVHSIGNEILKRNNNARVLYTTSEKFSYEFIDYVQNNKISEFNNKYRSVDVLIVDDIQFFGNREKTQDNFFHTFNALYHSGKQLVLISDKPPRELQKVDERLISRFQWGLTTDIQAPDFEMRVAILKKKSIDVSFEMPMEIIEFIARNVKKSVRELEGILISLMAKVTFDRKELTLSLAEETVYGVDNNEPKPITIELIKNYVSTYYKLSPEKLASKSRKHEIALARQMAIFLSKKFTQHSLKSIGSYFGNRDHSTVLHSCQAIENYLSNDENVRNAYEDLTKKLKK